LIQDCLALYLSPHHDPFIKLHNHDIKSFEYIPSYKRLIRRLLYLNKTLISWFSSLVNFHLNLLISIIMRHIKFLGSLMVVLVVGVFFSRDSSIHLGFSYVDSVGCIKTRRSVSGSCFFIGSSLISSKTKKKNIIPHTIKLQTFSLINYYLSPSLFLCPSWASLIYTKWLQLVGDSTTNSKIRHCLSD